MLLLPSCLDVKPLTFPTNPQYCKKCNTQQFERRGSQKRGKGEDSGVRPLPPAGLAGVLLAWVAAAASCWQQNGGT